MLEIGAFVTRFAHRSPSSRRPPRSLALAEPRRARAARVVGHRARRGPPAAAPRRASSRQVGASPPSEYLHAAALEGRFPRDQRRGRRVQRGLAVLGPADQPRRRRSARRPGAARDRVAPAGTSYVFNPSGQVIDAQRPARAVRRRGADRHAGQGRAAHEDARRHARARCRSCGARARCRAAPRRRPRGTASSSRASPARRVEDVALTARS